MSNPFVAAEKAKDADEFGVFGHRVEHCKLFARSGPTNILCFRGAEERQRMVVHIAHAVHVFHVLAVTCGVHDQGDGLEALCPAQAAGHSGREQVFAVIGGSHRDRFREVQPQDFVDEFAKVEGFTLKDRVKRHRKARCGPQYPSKPSMNILAVAAERAMFQLQINGVVVPDLTANVLNMFVCEAADATVHTAQQILVQIEHGYVEKVAQLLFETARISANAAQLVVG